MISLIFPTYNESESIAETLKNIRSLQIPALEIIVCDDHSPDHTLEAAAAADSDAVLLTHDGPKGLSPSVIYAFKQAKGDILVCMDADGQHRPADLPALIQAIEKSGFAVGSRFVPGGGFQDKWPWYRLLVSRVSAWLAKVFLHTEIRDPMSGFFGLKRDIFLKILPCTDPGGFKIMLELATFANALIRDLQITEVPILFANRKAGKSKASIRIGMQYLRMLFSCRKRLKQLNKSH